MSAYDVRERARHFLIGALEKTVAEAASEGIEVSEAEVLSEMVDLALHFHAERMGVPFSIVLADLVDSATSGGLILPLARRR